MTDTSTWATAIAAYGLGPPQGVLDGGPVEDSTWPRLLELARGQRLVGLMRAAAQDGVLALRGEQWAGLEKAFGEVAADSAEAERSAADLVIEPSSLRHRMQGVEGPGTRPPRLPVSRSAALRPRQLPRKRTLASSTRSRSSVNSVTSAHTPSRRQDSMPNSARGRCSCRAPDRASRSTGRSQTVPYAMIVEHGELFRTSSSVRGRGPSGGGTGT